MPKPDHLHPAHRARLKREKARRELRTCAMPLCPGKVIVDDERGPLGICFQCALDVAFYVQKLGDVPAMTERQAQRRLRELAEEQRRQALVESQAAAPGWIYYVRVTDRIKIGYSANVKNRMRSYPPHSELLAVHPGTPTLEREMHAQFASLLLDGREWFLPAPELMQHIDKVLAEFGPVPQRMVYRFRQPGERQRIKSHARR